MAGSAYPVQLVILYVIYMFCPLYVNKITFSPTIKVVSSGFQGMEDLVISKPHLMDLVPMRSWLFLVPHHSSLTETFYCKEIENM